MSDARPAPIEIESAVYLIRPTGRTAANLEELRAMIESASDDELFFHSQMPRLRRHREEDDFAIDDYSAWVRGVIQDPQTAERLAFAVQTSPHDPQQLKQSLLEVLGSLSTADRLRRTAPEGGALIGLVHETIRIPSGRVAHDAGSLVDALADAHHSSWFHHLIERSWAAPHEDTVAGWLDQCGAPKLGALVEDEASSGRTVEAMRTRVLNYWRRSRIARNLADRRAMPDDTRRETEQAVVAGLVKRLRHPQERP